MSEERTNGKRPQQNKIVFFYIVVILGLSFFVLLSTGTIPFEFPSVRTGLVQSSPDLTATKIQTLCSLEKYETIVLHSISLEGREYKRLVKEDLSGDILQMARNICYKMDTSRKVEKTKISDAEWEYRYFAGILFDSNQAFRIRYFDGDWRFVFSKLR